jgi:hypothetical protein
MKERNETKKQRNDFSEEREREKKNQSTTIYSSTLI